MRLSHRARVYIGLLVAAAAAVAAAALATLVVQPAQHVALLPLGALLVVAAGLAQHFPIVLSPNHVTTLVAAVFFSAVLLCPVALAVPVVGLGQLVGQLTMALRREQSSGRPRRSPAVVAFNTAQAVLAAGAGALVYSALRPAGPAAGGPPLEAGGLFAPLVPGGALGVLAALAAAAVMFVANTTAVATMISLQRGVGVWGAWRDAYRSGLPDSAGDYLLGFLAAWALPREPWLLVLAAAGAALVYRGVGGRAALAQRETELARRDAELARQEAEAAALREADRLKDDFLGTVSHELRTPLTVVCGFTELLQVRRDTLDPAAMTMVGHIAAGAERLLRMVDDLLDFARLQRGVLSARSEEIDLAPLLAGVVAELARQPDGDRLRSELPPALWAHADPARVAQATANFLSNALKYAPKGPVILHAGPAPAPPGEGDAPSRVRIEVLDTGPGIPEAEQGRVWEKFYRGESSAGRVRGTGIGLAVVKAVVEAQGGSVGLESAPGRGSRFWLELPAAAPRATGAPATT